MGQRGPAKTPQAINDLRGNPGKRSTNGRGPKFPTGAVRCPDFLNDVGRAKWEEMVSILDPVDGLLKPAFADMLAMYCEAWEEFIDARSEIEKEGATCTSDKGGAYQHPAVGRKNKAIQRLRQFGGLFGLSPSGETELELAATTNTEKEDPMLELLRFPAG